MILVTGASGFVGRAVCERVAKLHPLRVSIRDMSKSEAFANMDIFKTSSSSAQDWSAALVGVSVVVHCAARVHVMIEAAENPLLQFRQVNVEATLNLARQAAKAGVSRFIFLSSIKVNGEFTDLGHPFAADQTPAPIDPYGISKYEAEIGLIAISEETGMEVVIIRPPLVYGPGVKANFEAMMQWLKRGIPLPLGAVTHNRRSMVALGNLVDLITVCLNHPAAANQTFLVSDEETLSMTSLLRRTSVALGVKARLFSIPPILLKFAAKLIGREAVYQRLCGSLQIDMTKTQQLLDWKPPLSVDEGLRLAAEGDV